jgi:hypothetical protein
MKRVADGSMKTTSADGSGRTALADVSNFPHAFDRDENPTKKNRVDEVRAVEQDQEQQKRNVTS